MSDLRFRLHGLEEFKAGRHEDAFKFFQRASFYADKPSQGMVAEMLWNGQGVAKDPALAYAWMDLAAERGYVDMVIEPKETRPRIITALNALSSKREVGPAKKHGNIPL